MNMLNTSRRRLWLRYHILKLSVICCWPTGTPACRIFFQASFPSRIFFWQLSPHLLWYQGHLQRLWCRSNPGLVELGCYPCQRSIVGTLRVTVMSCHGTLDANNTVETFITLARLYWSQFCMAASSVKKRLRVSSRRTRRSLPVRSFPPSKSARRQ